jgi:hypothetical protein
MEEDWKAKEIENMLEENDEDMQYLNKHSHFHPYGFTVLKKPFKYMRINTLLRCLEKYSGLEVELGFIRKRNKGRTEAPEDGTEDEEVPAEEDVEEVEKSDDVEESDENEVEKSDDENEEDEQSDNESLSSEDEVCKSVKMKFKRSVETSDESDSDEDSGNGQFERARKKFKTKDSNVCLPCKKSFSTRSNAVRHY